MSPRIFHPLTQRLAIEIALLAPHEPTPSVVSMVKSVINASAAVTSLLELPEPVTFFPFFRPTRTTRFYGGPNAAPRRFLRSALTDRIRQRASSTGRPGL